ncbi:MAG: hypothetical protein CK425_00990 [Parachlamydia sp.]|nr:MAG: hypothetical protein CK425_00990 [Parachlamydia sp.]
MKFIYLLKIKSQVFDESIIRDYIARAKRITREPLYTIRDFPVLCKAADVSIGVPEQGDVWYATRLIKYPFGQVLHAFVF